MYTEKFLEKKERGSANLSYLGRTIDNIIWDFMNDEGIDGLTMSIVQAPYIPRVVGYGFSDSKQKRLSSTNTMWPIGHISQGFTAVAIMQLYEENKLDIHESISKYLEDIPNKWSDVTIIELLRHSSGIPDYRLSNKYDSSSLNTFKQLISLVENTDVNFNHGIDVKQSATNFLLLTEIIEKVTKQSYHDFVKERQIDFLGLKYTGFLEDLENFNKEDVSLSDNLHQLFKSKKEYINPTEHAASYDENGLMISNIECSNLKGFADIWSSSQDISFWDIALAGSILIHNVENRALIYSPWELPDGKKVPAVAGWQFYNHNGLMDIKGSVKGYSSFLSRFTDPKELVCVTLMANKEGIDFTNLGRRIAACYGDLLSTNYNDNNLHLLEGQFSVDEMVHRLEEELKKQSIPLFAKFDHAQNAKQVGMNLRPTTVLVFGSPKVGTNLMQEDQSISLELPLKISIWEDELGSTWLAYPNMKNMVSNYKVSNLKIVSNIEKTLKNIANKVVNIYPM